MTIQSMRVTEAREGERSCWSRSRVRVKFIIGMLVVLIILAAICGYYIGVGTDVKKPLEPPDTYYPLPPSPSKLYTFQKAAVCTDAIECSNIGKSMFDRNGSAIDATIAAMFCNGLFSQQSMGVGGGFIMTVYIKDERKGYSVIARERAMGAAYKDMYKDDHDAVLKGPLSVGVPGDVRGMWMAHQRWGKLPWSDLIQPTVKICNDGFIMSKALNDGLYTAPYIVNDSQLRKMYYDEKKKAFLPPGAFVKPSEALCKTLARIADKGGDDFYNGSLAADIVEDLKLSGSPMTAQDLANYKAEIREPISITLPQGDVLYTSPPPSCGLLLAFILNILKGYNFSPDSLRNDENMILTYHRIVEAFKHAYAARTQLGDEDYLDLTDLRRNLTSDEYAEKIRAKINDIMTSNDTAAYGVKNYAKDDAGTAHISVLAPNGDAVSVTSSINFYFGTGSSLYKTGIILNNVMDDFSIPGSLNYFGIEPSPVNYIHPGKRPLSSMNPAVIVDAYGNAKLVIGASGGTKITSAVAVAIMRTLWFGQDIKQAVDAPRFHHQIFPMAIEYEYGITQDVLDGLKAKGHALKRYRGRGSVVCAMFRNSTAVYGNADFRKAGELSGI